MPDNRQSSIVNRPIAVTSLALLVLTFSAWNGFRLGAAIASWQVLIEYGAKPLYIAISGSTWALAGITLFVGLWWGKVWARKAAFLAAAGYAAWYWFDRLVLQTPHANWPFALAVTVALLSFTIITLSLRGSKFFFSKRGA
ncbi:MAG: hypothetical protein Q7T47_08255 [Anaerolineales bacterium]|nr:hypothetical protein [Anaerolineales bacterium]